MVASAATCQAIWLIDLLGERLGVGLSVPRLKVDNKAVINLIRNPVHHGRRKCIRIHYYFVRECVAEGRIEVQFVATGDQLADILTKPL
jgi:hypothetical protein